MPGLLKPKRSSHGFWDPRSLSSVAQMSTEPRESRNEAIHLVKRALGGLKVVVEPLPQPGGLCDGEGRSLGHARSILALVKVHAKPMKTGDFHRCSLIFVGFESVFRWFSVLNLAFRSSRGWAVSRWASAGTWTTARSTSTSPRCLSGRELIRFHGDVLHFSSTFA